MELFEKLIPNFLFILLRAGIAMTMLPYLGSTSFPARFRIGLAVAVSLVLAPLVEFHVEKADIPVVIAREVMFGMILGLAARFVFYAVDMAGHVMSSAAGMSAANTFNPEIGQTSELSLFYNIVATLLFFAVDAHHELIAVFVRSYEFVPAGAISAQGLAAAAASFTSRLFVIALKISAPVVIIVLITNILLGFIAKAAPQMPIFFVGHPLYIFLGFLTMLVSLPVFVYLMEGYFKGIPGEMERVMLMMRR